jgi:hypothetical protein
MNADTFLEEFKRLTIENEQLKQEIKQTRITKNLEIDEVEQLYTKTSTELKELKEKYNKLSSEQKTDKLYSLTEYKGLSLTEALIEIIDFKQTKEFTEFEKDWYEMAVPYLNEFYSVGIHMFGSSSETRKKFNEFKKKYKNVMDKYKIIKELLQHYDLIGDYGQYQHQKKSYAQLILLRFLVDDPT